jgi:hypothetical protein
LFSSAAKGRGGGDDGDGDGGGNEDNGGDTHTDGEEGSLEGKGKGKGKGGDGDGGGGESGQTARQTTQRGGGRTSVGTLSKERNKAVIGKLKAEAKARLLVVMAVVNWR